MLRYVCACYSLVRNAGAQESGKTNVAKLLLLRSLRTSERAKDVGVLGL